MKGNVTNESQCHSFALSIITNHTYTHTHTRTLTHIHVCAHTHTCAYLVYVFDELVSIFIVEFRSHVMKIGAECEHDIVGSILLGLSQCNTELLRTL